MFNIKTFIASALAMFQTTFSTEWPHVKDIALSFLTSKQARLNELALSRLDLVEPISDSFFFDRIKDEGAILQSEAAALAIIGQAKAENIANTFATFFLNTVINLIPGQP